jgi:osmotically-inducible protein OsmY
MANDYRDKNRGMFGYEGEGYLRGGGRDLDREYGGRDDEERGWERGRDRDRGYGRYGSAGHGMRGDYTTSFTGGGYGTGGRGAYGERGYGGGYGSNPQEAGYRGGGYLGGDYPGGTDYGDRTHRGQSFPSDSGPRTSYRGRGPKNYQRSDERIREDVCERLEQDHYIDATDIEVTVSGGTVTLSGSVNERGAKRRAEDVAESVSGVRDVENRIRLAHDDEAK